MALRIWLPLNGNLENKGISDYEIRSANITIADDGKIGKCYSFNGSNSYINITNFEIGNNWSYGCWVNTPNSDSRGWEIVMILNNSGSDADSQFAFWVHQKENRFESLANTQYVSTIPYTNYYNNWHHFFATFNGTLLTTYIDGNVVNTKTITATQYNAVNLTIGARSTNAAGTAFASWFQGKLNDVRIYDHCLSAKEVKEISQGLVLHYKLNNSSITNYFEEGNLIPNYKEMQLGSANVKTGTWRTAGTNNMTRTRIQIIDSPVGECYCFQNSGIQTANDGSCYGIDSTTYFEPNTEYRISMFARITAGTEGYAGYNIYNISEELGGSHTKIDKNYRVTPLNSDGTWTYCWYHIKTNSSTTRNIYIGITTGETSVTTQMCLVRIDKWNDGMSNNIIKDSSGYENNGVITNIPLIQNDTPRYQNSMKLSKKKINCSSCFMTTENPIFTISFWFKLYSDITYTSYADLLSLSTSSYSSQPFRLEICGSPAGKNIMWFRGPSGNSGGFTVGSTSSGWYALDQWHHTALVSAGDKQYICYFDGVQTNTFNGSSYSWTPTGNLSIGDNSEGTASFSDFRIYATALSAEDILDLYHTPANIDNLQNIHTFEFRENSEKTSIYQNGITSTTNEIHESNAELLNTMSVGGYTPAKNTVNSCTNFGYANFDNYASLGKDLAVHIECDVEWTAFTADTGGTFRGVWFQGANYEIASSSFKWAGTNYICSALNSAFSLQTISTITTAGKHHYDITTTIPASWFATYSRSDLGWRCDYSDGTGHIDIKNLKITPLQYYNAKIGEDFISANNFIEK